MDDGVWRTPGWWRNRSLEDRLAFCKAPKRMDEVIDLSNAKLHKWLENYQPGSLLTLEGRNTWACARDAYGLLYRIVQSKQPGPSGRWITASQYVEMVHDSFGQSDETLPSMYSSPHLLKYLKSTFDVVVLDDLGAEHRTDYSSQVIGDLIKRRYEKELTTIVTTSSTPFELASRYGGRVGAYLGEGEVIRIGRQ